MAIPKVIVCGGRDFNDRTLLFDTLDQIFLEKGWITNEPKDNEDGNWLPQVHIISGKARGADSLALDYAAVNWCKTTEKPAEWDKYGKSAGYIRNAEMLQEGPDLVVAFPGGRGTKNMVDISKKAGVPVIEV